MGNAMGSRAKAVRCVDSSGNGKALRGNGVAERCVATAVRRLERHGNSIAVRGNAQQGQEGRWYGTAVPGYGTQYSRRRTGRHGRPAFAGA